MANDRVSQLPIEVLVLPQPKGRWSQVAVEALVLPQPKMWASQVAVEVLLFAYEIKPPFIASTTTVYAPTLAKALPVPFLDATTVLYPPVLRRASVVPPFIESTTRLFTPRLVRPLVNISPPAISGSPTEGQQLECSPGIWDGTPPFVYDFQWLRCDAGGGSCVAIAGATGATYIVTAADVGSTLRCRVTASDSA